MRRATGMPIARHAKAIVAVALAFAIAIAGIGRPVEDRLRLLRDSLHDRPASGRIVLVEIDANSLHGVGQWPWPRRLHAALLDKLRAGGAAAIAYDVDFSAASIPSEDAAFAAALARAQGSAILPTFRQSGSNMGRDIVENLPIAAFRNHSFLASANVRTAADGQLKRYDFGTVTGGVTRPSIAAMLAGASGRMGETFRIDPTIDPGSIPRLSAIDVLERRFDDTAVRGKSVLIGATAIEMGDRYSLPGRGVLPGVVAQVLAAETLIAGTGGLGFGTLPALLVAGGLLFVYSRGRRFPLGVRILGAAALGGVPILFELAGLPTIAVVPALVMLTIDGLWTAGAGVWATLQRERGTDEASGLPNQRALVQSVTVQGEIAVVALRMMRIEEMETVLDAAMRGRLTARVVDRLAVGFPEAHIHLVAPGVFAWIDHCDDVGTLSDRIESAAALFRAPLDVGGRAMLITPSFGICLGEGRDAAQLIAQAGLAARTAQENGQRWAIHSDASTSHAERTLVLLGDIDAAIDDGDISVVFQPKWSIARQSVCGAEALVRWRHPRLGQISPDAFIPLLESTGNIARLTLSVLDTCLDRLTQWQRTGSDLGVAVNVSAMLLNDAFFVGQLSDRLQAAAGVRHRLTLEITESAAIETADTAIAALVAARALGVRISIDDYGTGHATLNYLKSFPADEIKIDKSFVTAMLASVSDQILVRSTVEMARELGFSVVAEGVEDRETLAKLGEFGCDIAQGWVIGRPVDAPSFTAQWIDVAPAVRHAA